jgi:glycosyltransferase involved in cell wall biosynthesis
MKDFLFSIIISYKDTEKYIQTTLDSLYRQTCGFRELVQVILVNDGSKDNSKNIVELNKKYYPNNITSIDSLGNGVAAAKNTGLKYANGKYVNFLDSDDYLSDDALQKVLSYFDKNEEIDIVAIPMYFFDNQVGPHMLNKKFTYSRVIDINEEPESILLSSASSFIKRSSIEQSFDENLSFGEDSLFITSMLMYKQKYGVVADAQYYYRKRVEGTSLMQNTYNNVSYYTTFLDHFILRLISEYELKKSKSNYLQHVIAYNIQWPLRKQERPKGMSSEILEEYWGKIEKILTYLDESAIESMEYLSFHQKNYLIRMKNSKDTYRVEDNNVFIERSGQVVDRLDRLSSQILKFDKKDNDLILVGRIGSLFDYEDLKIYGEVKGKKVTSSQYIERKTKIMGTTVKEFTDFRVTIPLNLLNKDSKIYVIAECRDIKKKIKFKNDSLINKKVTYQGSSIQFKYSKDEKSILIPSFETKTVTKNQENQIKKVQKSQPTNALASWAKQRPLIRKVYRAIKQK